MIYCTSYSPFLIFIRISNMVILSTTLYITVHNIYYNTYNINDLLKVFHLVIFFAYHDQY